jgi:hypothetical protein
MTYAERTPASTTDRLAIVFERYRGMVDEGTGRLVYLYDPEADAAVSDGEAIRDIASVWDVEELGRFLGRDGLVPVAERSLHHFLSWRVDRDGASFLDPWRLGEPSGIAHSAFLLLGLLASALSGREEAVAALAEGILRQQRPDGSFRIYFGEEPDDGLEFYPGEAMLALLETHAAFPDPRIPDAVARGFRHYRTRLPVAEVEDGLAVFYANWLSQYANRLHAIAGDELRRELDAYVFALHDRIVQAGFYQDLERHPGRQATVEVACALEGLADVHAIAMREADGARAGAYARCSRLASAWLRDAQRLEGGTARERGGFGATRTDRRQRIDVTGHVAAAWRKCIRGGIER